MKKYNESIGNRIRDYVNSSEILTTYMQLGIIALIATFYAVAPKGFDGVQVIFQPVPYALGVWFAVLIVRMCLAHTHRMHGIIMHIFVLLDVALLLTLIWSYSVQYQTTLAFSLKAPTFIFVLFFIFLRALRFEIQYIISGYIISVVGWAFMTFIAYTTGPVTHSFLKYTTANVVLLGAEIERILALTASTAVILIIVVRSQRMLTFSQQQRFVVHNLSLFFSQNVVKRIAAENDTIQAGKGEERHGAILSIDIRGFTQYSATHSAAEVIETISEYQGRIIPVAQENSGSIDKFMGDGILIHFGIADDSTQYAASALQAAEQIVTVMREWSNERRGKNLTPIVIGIGIDMGKIIFGTVGDETRLEFTVIGNAVNMSSKLEKATKRYPGQVLVTKECYDMARKQGYSPTAYTPFLVRKQTIGDNPEPIDVVTLLTTDQKREMNSPKE